MPANLNEMFDKIQELENSLVYPAKPTKPFLTKDANSKQVATYAQNLAVYEDEFAEFEKLRLDYYERKKVVDAQIEEILKDESGFYFIPTKYQEKVWYKAFHDGHSNGWQEVYNCLVSLVEIF